MQRLEAFGDRVRAFAKPWEMVSFVWVPAIGLAYAAWFEMRAHDALQDFNIFRTAAVDVIHGRSPYVHPSVAAFSHFDKFVYPPFAAVLFAPFTALPAGMARVLMFVLGLAALLGALRLLGVEDWRCYGLAIFSAPVINTLALGAVTSFLLLGVALAWRHRDNALVAGVATAFAALLKLFLWPLGIWLIATRRWRAALLCLGAGTILLLGGWAMIGFAGFRGYPTMLHVLQGVEAPVSYSTIALLGLSGRAATLVTIVLSIGTVAAVVLAARSRDGDRRALAVAVVASLFATPLLWLHYLVLVYVPLALYRPRLSGVWFVPLLFWLTPTTHSQGATWRIALDLAVTAIVAARTLGGSAETAFSRPGVSPRPAVS